MNVVFQKHALIILDDGKIGSMGQSLPSLDLQQYDTLSISWKRRIVLRTIRFYFYDYILWRNKSVNNSTLLPIWLQREWTNKEHIHFW